MELLQIIANANSKALFVGMLVGSIAYIAKEQENQDQKPIRAMVRLALGAVMGYFLPPFIVPIIGTFFNIKDVALDAVLAVLAGVFAYGNLDVIKWSYLKIQKKADGKVD